MKVEFRPRRLGHVNLWVGQLERSIEFYNKVCGIELTYLEAGIRAGFHSNGNTHHDVGLVEVSKGVDRVGRDGKVQIAATRGTKVGLNHLGWEMESEAALVAACQRLREARYRTPRYADHVITHSVYVSDPDGNVHEFYADAISDWRQVFNLDHEELLTGEWDPFGALPNSTPYHPTDPQIRQVSGAPLQPIRTAGATFASARFDEMKTFLIDVAGLDCAELPAARPRQALFSGGCGCADITLVEVQANEPVGLRKFAFEVHPSMDFTSIVERLAEVGVHNSRVESSEIRSAVALTDPDGFRVEFYVPKSSEVSKSNRGRSIASSSPIP